jgi:hypothetical protein
MTDQISLLSFRAGAKNLSRREDQQHTLTEPPTLLPLILREEIQNFLSSF